MRVDEYIGHDATGLAQLVREGELSATELLETAVGVIETQNPHVNAVVRGMVDEARAAIDAGLPEGPFRGVPFLLKDLIADYAGVPTTSGSRLFAHRCPSQDHEIVARYKRAGLVVVGKTNTPELGIMGITEPALFGPTRNPWALDRTPGGSSGGSAAAVASGMVPAAHAGDGGGSIRIPASACGLVGLKPSRGRSPVGPSGESGWGGMVEQHVVTRTMRDCAALLDVIAGDGPAGAPHARRGGGPFAADVERDPGKLRIAFTTTPLLTGTTHPACATAVERAARCLERLGHEVSEAHPEIDRHAMTRAYILNVAAGIYAELRDAQQSLGRRASERDLEPTTWLFYDIGRRTSAEDLERSRMAVNAARLALRRFGLRHDVLLTPTLAQPPARIGELLPRPAERALMWTMRRAPLKLALERAMHEMAHGMLARMPNTQLFNLTGQPAMSLPLHVDETGLPIGVQVAGRIGDEATLFRLGAQLEVEMPWSQRRAPGLELLWTV